MKGKKRQRNNPAQTPQTTPVPATSFNMRRLLLGAVLVLAALGTWAVFEFVVWNKVPAELVGKWVVMSGPDEGGTVDFFRNGTMVAKVNQGGVEGIINATVRVEDKKIHVTTRHQQTGQEGVRVQTIKTLERHRLSLEDERGNSIDLKRVE